MTDIPTVYRALTRDEQRAMEQALVLAARIAGTSSLGFPELQSLYDRMLMQSDRDDEEVIALGMAFGAAINEWAGFDWVRVSDEWGDETCVGPPHKTTHCAPISMIQKRLNRQEEVDLQELANALVNWIRVSVTDGKTGDR